MDIELMIFDDLMRKYHRYGLLLGFTTASSPEEYFGFNHLHVKTVHTHKNGFGEGVWFRLRDGRVIDQVAMPDDPDPLAYDQRVN
jgi:hypothetical protein